MTLYEAVERGIVHRCEQDAAARRAPRILTRSDPQAAHQRCLRGNMRRVDGIAPVQDGEICRQMGSAAEFFEKGLRHFADTARAEIVVSQTKHLAGEHVAAAVSGPGDQALGLERIDEPEGSGSRNARAGGKIRGGERRMFAREQSQHRNTSREPRHNVAHVDILPLIAILAFRHPVVKPLESRHLALANKVDAGTIGVNSTRRPRR